MKLNSRSLFEELNITYNESSKHGTSGWLQFTCPYCDDHKDHLGYHIGKEYFHCWRCGWHPLIDTIAELCNISKWEASQAIERHRTGRGAHVDKNEVLRPEKLRLPKGCMPLNRTHISYLQKRGFPLEAIKKYQQLYSIQGTGPMGEYKLRLVFPITHYGKVVSYQSRDITGKATKKYLACAGENEVRPHKQCLFGADLVRGSTVIIVEGILDALKLGPGAVATFGVEISWAQIKQIADRWKNRFVAFDSDRVGRLATEKVSAMLSGVPGNTYCISFNKAKDPGELGFEKAQKFMKSIII